MYIENQTQATQNNKSNIPVWMTVCGPILLILSSIAVVTISLASLFSGDESGGLGGAGLLIIGLQMIVGSIILAIISHFTIHTRKVFIRFYSVTILLIWLLFIGLSLAESEFEKRNQTRINAELAQAAFISQEISQATTINDCVKVIVDSHSWRTCVKSRVTTKSDYEQCLVQGAQWEEKYISKPLQKSDSYSVSDDFNSKIICSCAFGAKGGTYVYEKKFCKLDY
jgi:hypothetical protein